MPSRVRPWRSGLCPKIIPRPDLATHSVGWKIWQVVKTIQARLRFFVLLAGIGAIIVYWDALNAVYEKWTRPAAAQETADADSEYWCPMHPTIVRDHPDNCPICGMPLSKRKKRTGEVEALPPGVVNRVQLTPYRVALAGIQTAPVEYRELTRHIEAAGFVEFDETKLTRITNHISGRSRIDKLYVNVTDQNVAEGAPLVDLYSPDLDATMQDLLNAHHAGDKRLEAMNRERLKLWGVQDDQVQQALDADKPITHVTIRSPSSGHVLRKYVLEGDTIDEGARLFDVADLSTVWIEAQVFEDDLAFLQQGPRRPRLSQGVPQPGVHQHARLHPPAPGRRDAHAQGALRPGQPRPRPAAGHVRHGSVRRAGDGVGRGFRAGGGTAGGAHRRRPHRPRAVRAGGTDGRIGAGVAGAGRGEADPVRAGSGAGRSRQPR